MCLGGWGGGCSSWKIDIHLNHKSELSQCLWGGEIIIGLVLDYTLCRAEARAACKCALRCFVAPHTHTHTLSPPHTHADVHGEIRSLRCIEASVRCRPCQATSRDRSTRVYGGLRRVSSITPSMKSPLAALDLEDEEWGPRAGMCACVFRGVSEQPSPATAISQNAPAMFGNGGWRIGLCGCIANNPMYQRVDMLG